MKLSSNYNSKQWQRLFAYFSFTLTLYILPLVLVAGYVVLPMIDQMIMFDEWLYNGGYLEKYGEWLVANYEIEEIDTLALFVSMFLTLGGAVLLSIVFFWLVSWLTSILVFKLAEMLKLKPMMKLVVFKNGKPIKW